MAGEIAVTESPTERELVWCRDLQARTAAVRGQQTGED
jgi:hypothetical protein